MPVGLDPELLRRVDLFEGLTAEQLTRLASLLHGKTFAAGATLFSEEQPGEVAYLIVSGTVKIYVEEEDGTDAILAILGAGEIVGEMSLVDSLGRSASVVTLEECIVFWIDRTTFWQCLQTMLPMTYNLTRILSRRLRLANHQIQSLATHDVHGRVARQILAFSEEYGRPAPGGGTLIPLRLTQNDLAALVGASRVRVNQVLSSWKRLQYISLDDDHRITVHDTAALAQRCR